MSASEETHSNERSEEQSFPRNWFLANKTDIQIPYVEQNQKNKLRQLAQQNNREFKKLLHDKA